MDLGDISLVTTSNMLEYVSLVGRPILEINFLQSDLFCFVFKVAYGFLLSEVLL